MNESAEKSYPLIVPVPSAQAQAMFDVLSSRPNGMDRDIRELRRQSKELYETFGGTAERVASITDVNADGVRARLYCPEQERGGVFVWFHGGAWMLGELDDNDAHCCAIANRASCKVLSVDYRLAPEHPYPAAIEDSWTAAKWALKQSGKVAVGGDSAGGNLAAVVALRARDENLQLSLQLLVYPVLDANLQTPFLNEFKLRYAQFLGDPNFGENAVAGLQHIWNVYVPERARQADVDASPMRALSLTGVAPALIILAEHDPLRGEGEEYARRLESEGVKVQLYVYAGQTHGFFGFVEAFDDAWNAIDRSAAALRIAFGHDHAST